jgi:hypothetical protein
MPAPEQDITATLGRYKALTPWFAKYIPKVRRRSRLPSPPWRPGRLFFLFGLLFRRGEPF